MLVGVSKAEGIDQGDGDCYCEQESTEGKSALVHHPVHRRHRLQHRLW